MQMMLVSLMSAVMTVDPFVTCIKITPIYIDTFHISFIFFFCIRFFIDRQSSIPNFAHINPSGAEYSGRKKSMPVLLMPWVIVSPSHQLPMAWIVNDKQVHIDGDVTPVR